MLMMRVVKKSSIIPFFMYYSPISAFFMLIYII